jgi:hypothetical protein
MFDEEIFKINIGHKLKLKVIIEEFKLQRCVQSDVAQFPVFDLQNFMFVLFQVCHSTDATL